MKTQTGDTVQRVDVDGGIVRTISYDDLRHVLDMEVWTGVVYRSVDIPTTPIGLEGCCWTGIRSGGFPMRTTPAEIIALPGETWTSCQIFEALRPCSVPYCCLQHVRIVSRMVNIRRYPFPHTGGSHSHAMLMKYPSDHAI